MNPKRDKKTVTIILIVFAVIVLAYIAQDLYFGYLGAELSARFSNFLFVPLGGSIGVCVEWNGGTLFDEVRDQTGQSRITAGLSYSMDF